MRIVVLCLLVVGGAFANPTVSNIRVDQLENTKLVEILYDVSFIGGDTVAVSCEVSTNAGVSFDVPVSSFSGDYGAIVSTGADRSIVWDAGLDWDENYSEQMKVRITASAPRFVDNGDGTVTDNDAGLIWRRSTDGLYNYDQAMTQCGLYGEGWRIPTIYEIQGLADQPTLSGLPYGHPFSINQGTYWSSSMFGVTIIDGDIFIQMKSFSFYNRVSIPVNYNGSYVQLYDAIPMYTEGSIYLLAVKSLY